MQKYSYDNYNVYIIKSNKFKTIRIHTIITNKYELGFKNAENFNMN